MARSGQGYLGLLRRRRGLTDQELADLPGSSVQPALGYYPGVTGGPLGILDRPAPQFSLTPLDPIPPHIGSPGMPQNMPMIGPPGAPQNMPFVVGPGNPAYGPLSSRLAKPLPPALSMPQRQAPALSSPQAPDTMGGLLNSTDHVPGEIGAAIPQGFLDAARPQSIVGTPLEDPFSSPDIKDAGYAPEVDVTAQREYPGVGMSYQPPGLKQEQPQAQTPQTHVDQQNGFGSPTALALLSAGLGILANNTGHYGQAGPAIGKGGMIGLNTFMQLKQQQIANEQAKAKMAMQEDQHKAYMQQVQGQIMGQQRLNDADVRKQAIIREMMNYPQDSKEFKSLEMRLAAEQGQLPSMVKAMQFNNGKPLMMPVNGPDGLPKKDEQGNIMWSVTAPNPMTGELETKVTYKSPGFQPPENTAKKVAAEGQGALVKTQLQKAEAASGWASQVKMLNDLMADYSGGPADALAAKLGSYFPATKDLRDRAAIGQVVQSMALTASREFKMPGATSNYEQQLYLSAVPTLMWTREGRQLMTDLALKMRDRQAAIHDWMDSRVANGERISMAELNKYADSLGPMFSDEEKKALFNQSSQKQQSEPQQASSPRKKKEPDYIGNTDPSKGPVAPPGFMYEGQ